MIDVSYIMAKCKICLGAEVIELILKLICGNRRAENLNILYITS